jgi:hypothetical protein
VEMHESKVDLFVHTSTILLLVYKDNHNKKRPHVIAVEGQPKKTGSEESLTTNKRQEVTPAGQLTI